MLQRGSHSAETSIICFSPIELHGTYTGNTLNEVQCIFLSEDGVLNSGLSAWPHIRISH